MSIRLFQNLSSSFANINKSTTGNAMGIITATARRTNIAIITAIVLIAAYTTPPPPVVRVTRVDTHGLSVSWTPGQSSSPDSYRVVVTENGFVRYYETFTQSVTSADIPDLLPGHLYNISVWAVQSGQKSAAATITTYTGKDETTLPITLIVVAIIAALLLAAVVIAVCLYRRGWFGGDTTDRSNIPIGPLKPSTRLDKSRPVKIVDFANHVAQMRADSDFKYSEEYQDLKPVGRDQSLDHAKLPVNQVKNRFINILPYDHSRVKLLSQDDSEQEGTDYINANYMPGYSSKCEYIVTQGPLLSSRDDFWRMIWEQGAQAIVMLTRCVEGLKEKCDHYWPLDSDPVYYGDIQVAILNETKSSEWEISEFRLTMGDQTRNIRHFHFMVIADFGVTDHLLLKFVRHVRSKLSTSAGPVTVHCSAGVGLSGVFVCLDYLLQHIQEHDYVDIYGLVYNMRMHRVSMVQTEQQYICIHDSILRVLEDRENELDGNQDGLDNP